MSYKLTPTTVLSFQVFFIFIIFNGRLQFDHKKGDETLEVNTAHLCTHTNRHEQYQLSTTEDRGVEGVHIGGVNRACGDSRVVGGSAGSRSGAAERNHSQFRFAADPRRNSSLPKMQRVLVLACG